MVKITQERVEKLDTLYDILGDKSPIIARIKGDIDSISDTKKQTEEKKSEHENERGRLQTELENFVFEAASFQDKFSGLDNSSFTSLSSIGIDVKFGTLLNRLREEMPKYKERLETKIGEEENAINFTVSEIEKFTNLLDTEKEKLIEIEAVIGQINNVIEDILLRKNDSYSPKYVKDLLDKLGVFPEEDIIILGSLILFPESGLQEYVAEYRDRNREVSVVNDIETVVATIDEPVKEISIEEPVISTTEEEVTPVVEETPTPIIEEVPEEKEPEAEVDFEVELEVEEATQNEEVNQQEVDINLGALETAEIPEIQISFDEPETATDEITEKISEIVGANPFEETKVEEPSSIELFLESINLSVDKFEEYNSKAKALEILSNAERDLIENNYEMLRSINAPEEVIYVVTDDMYMCLADHELSSKINLLRSKGIQDYAIRNELQKITTPKSFFKENLETIKERITALESKNNQLTEETLLVLSNDIVNLTRNISLLADTGIELDEKDERNYQELLTLSSSVAEVLEALKDYTVRLVRKNNGKYALSVFWKNPYDVTCSIDDLIECNLENIIDDNVEVLGKNVASLLQRIKYCEENGVSVVNEDGKYCSYIFDAKTFEKEVGDVTLPDLGNRENNNSQIGALVDNEEFVNILVEILNELYSNHDKYPSVDLEDAIALEQYRSIKDQVIPVLNAELVGKNTYKVGDIYLSKVKIERNIAILVSRLLEKGEQIDNLTKEIIITSALYNTLIPVEKLQATFGLTNLENNVGGLNL